MSPKARSVRNILLAVCGPLVVILAVIAGISTAMASSEPAHGGVYRCLIKQIQPGYHEGLFGAPVTAGQLKNICFARAYEAGKREYQASKARQLEATPHVYRLDRDYPAFSDMKEAVVTGPTDARGPAFKWSFVAALMKTRYFYTVSISRTHYAKVLADMHYVSDKRTVILLSNANVQRLLNPLMIQSPSYVLVSQ